LTLKHCKKLAWPLHSFAMAPTTTHPVPEGKSYSSPFCACTHVCVGMHIECVGPHYGPPVTWRLTTAVPFCTTSIPFIIHRLQQSSDSHCGCNVALRYGELRPEF
jgi:hypothetical protein